MNTKEKLMEKIAMNIVFQIGDELYDALPKDVAHRYFVDARQKTNDKCIDFVQALLTSEVERIIGEDEQWFWQNGKDGKQINATANMNIKARNDLRAEQRKALSDIGGK